MPTVGPRWTDSYPRPANARVDATATPAPSRERRPPGTRRDLGIDVAVLSVATVLLRLPALFASRHLTFDDGVFGASAVAMRHGALPFRDVFSSQGPLFLPLVWIADVAGLRTLDAPRLLAVASGITIVLATYAAGREIGDRRGALVAAGLVAVSGSLLWTTGPLSADGPALAFATLAVAGAFRYRNHPSTLLAVGIGLAFGAALSVKSIVLPIALPIGIVLLTARRPRDLLAAVGAAVAVGAIATLTWGAGDVWDQSVAYHLEASGERDPISNFRKILSTLGDRDLLVLVAAATAVGAAGFRRLHRNTASSRPTPEPLATRLRSSGALLASWLGAVFVLLVAEHPLWRPHIAHLVPPLALLVAWRRPPWRALALVAIVVVPYQLVHTWSVLWPDAYDAPAEAVVTELRELPDGALVISDDPGLVWRAGKATPPDLVDTSILRIESNRITTGSVTAAASDPEVCAVVVWSSRFGDLDGLPAALRDEGYEPALTFEGDRTLWLRPSCAD